MASVEENKLVFLCLLAAFQISFVQEVKIKSGFFYFLGGRRGRVAFLFVFNANSRIKDVFFLFGFIC